MRGARLVSPAGAIAGHDNPYGQPPCLAVWVQACGMEAGCEPQDAAAACNGCCLHQNTHLAPGPVMWLWWPAHRGRCPWCRHRDENLTRTATCEPLYCQHNDVHSNVPRLPLSYICRPWKSSAPLLLSTLPSTNCNSHRTRSSPDWK